MTDEQLDELEVEERFATVPEWLLLSDAKDRAVRLYAVIQRYGNTTGARMPSHAELGRVTHRGMQAVRDAINDLEDLGALRVKRSKVILKGETGVTRAPNRYFLRTTDPAIGHLLPAQGSPLNRTTPSPKNRTRVVRQIAHDREKTLNTSPPTPTPRSRQARSEEALPAAVLSAIDSVDTLCDELREARLTAGLTVGRWTNRLIRRSLTAAFEAECEPALMRDALHAIALDPETRTPGRLPHDGPWWELADRNRRAIQSTFAKILRDACQDCTNGWIEDHAGLPISKCPSCHPSLRSRTA